MNSWDTLSSTFVTRTSDAKIDPDAADNVLIAWPVVFKFIKKYLPKNKRILDFGCGTGEFAHNLRDIGYDAIGVDTSKNMIAIAKKSFGNHYHHYGSDNLGKLEKFDAVVSVMVFQFIRDIEKTIADLVKSLHETSILVFVVFNPNFVVEYLKNKHSFQDFDSQIMPTKGLLVLNNVKIPTFIRSAKEYNSLLEKHGFTKIFEEYPPFTEEFTQKYPQAIVTKSSEYMILGYKK